VGNGSSALKLAWLAGRVPNPHSPASLTGESEMTEAERALLIAVAEMLLHKHGNADDYFPFAVDELRVALQEVREQPEPGNA